MKIYQLSATSRVVQNIKYNRLQAYIGGQWVTVSKHPAKIRPIPKDVMLLGSAS